MFFDTQISNLLVEYPEVDHMEILFLVFLGNCIEVSEMVTLIYILANVCSLHIFTDSFCLCCWEMPSSYVGGLVPSATVFRVGGLRSGWVTKAAPASVNQPMGAFIAHGPLGLGLTGRGRTSVTGLYSV